MSGRRILMVVSFANLAGAQIAALRVARGLRDRGHEPRVVFLYQVSPIAAPDHPYEVLMPTERPGVGGYLSMPLLLAKLIREERPDSVLTFMPLASVLGQGAALFAGVGRRIVSHRVPAGTVRPVMRSLDAAAAWAGLYTDMIAVSESVRASCRHYPGWLRRRAVVVYNGLFDWHPSRLTRDEARRHYSVAERMLALVAVGRLAEQKDYTLTLRILQRLDNVVLLIGGEGAQRAQLERLADDLSVSDRVRFLGALARNEIPDLLAAADIFIQTSAFEGQSNAVLEALQAGLPVVAHDIPEQRETLSEADGTIAGALVALGDIDAWVGAIERLRSDPEAAQAARRAAGRRSSAFGFDTMISGFERVLTSDPELRESAGGISHPGSARSEGSGRLRAGD